ncbi:MAG: hypothetical protein KatS3mg102_0947 [Planctomycetota bacterium]|nr:MAG: hypothetical protein KatS3mg102_0947 [Planctomycetota bacterium]
MRSAGRGAAGQGGAPGFGIARRRLLETAPAPRALRAAALRAAFGTRAPRSAPDRPSPPASLGGADPAV